MNQLFKIGDVVQTETSKMDCKITGFLGSGGQGEVYRVNLAGNAVALKWYFPHYLRQDPSIRRRLEMTASKGAPNDRFLWPLELASGKLGFGYIMALREPRFKGFVDLMKRRVDPTFYVLATAGLELSHAYLLLHASGLCYRDISFGNVFFDPANGEVRICDNDNVDINGKVESGGILGTPRFMAPEIVRGTALPSTQTDLFSLAVLLFYMLIIHHPLEGKREYDIHALDQHAMNRLYGSDPVFIFDPVNDQNRPVPGWQNNALEFWPIYPPFLHDLFTQSFTVGLHDPDKRVRESEWRRAMIRLRDSIIYCAACGKQNFYKSQMLSTETSRHQCWACNTELRLPYRIRIDKDVIMLNHDTVLFPHHVDLTRLWDFGSPIARVIQHPSDPRVWGLQNLSPQKWAVIAVDGTTRDIDPGRTASLFPGIRIDFGKTTGEVRI